MTTQIKAGVIAANAVNSSELASGALSGQNFTGDIAFDTTTLKIDSSNNRVGIGTSSPATNLHIGSGTEGENLGVKLNRGATTNFFVANDGTKSAYIGVDNTQGYMKMGSLTNHPVSISQNNANAIYIDTSKNVGIGTESPTEKLTVNGAITTTAALSDDRTSTGSMDFISGFTRFVSYGASGENGAFSFNTASGGSSSAQKMVIDGSGNVGIGTNSPSTYGENSAGFPGQLVVANTSGHASLNIISSTSGDAAIGFGDGTGSSVYRGAIAYVNTSDKLYLKASAANRVVISGASSSNTPGMLIGSGSHGWGNLVVTSDDNSYDGGITISAAGTSGGSSGYGALFWKQGGYDVANTKWFMGFINSTSGGAAYDDILIGAYNLNTGYSRGGRSDGVMHFDRSTGDIHVAKQINFHGQPGFKVYDDGFTKATNWETISDSILTVEYNNGGWNSSTGRFLPDKAGYYLFTFGGWAAANSDGSRYATSFSKNGSQKYISGGQYASVDSPLNGHSEIIYLNGSSDYVDLKAYSAISTTWGVSSHYVWWGAEFLH